MHSDPSNASDTCGPPPQATLREPPPRPPPEAQLRESPPRPPPNPQPDSPFHCIDWPRLCKQLHLTPRESEVLQLIVEQDLAAAALALHLGISERTVTTHIANIENRLNVHSRSGIVSTAWSTWIQMTADDTAVHPDSKGQ